MLAVKRKFSFLKKTVKYCCYSIAVVVVYVLFSIVLSYITVNENSENKNDLKTVYLHSNGVHLSVILPIKSMSDVLKKDLILPESHQFAKFGWGDKDFYMNVPTWNDFKVKYAFGAFFLDHPTLIHVKTYKSKQERWIPIKANEED